MLKSEKSLEKKIISIFSRKYVQIHVLKTVQNIGTFE